MRILWITNIELPKIASKYGRNVFLGGWLVQTSVLLSAYDNIDLHILSPSEDSYSNVIIDSIHYYSFVREKINRQLERMICENDFDIVHIWGTEYVHSYDAIKLIEKYGLLNRVVISIQGLISKCAEVYHDGVPDNIVKKCTIYERMKHCGIYEEAQDFKRKGEYEIASLKTVRHCIGRTDWDYKAVKEINPDINYHKCNEILRKAFYENEWDFSKCRKNTISYGQIHYSLKGFHYMVEALHLIKEKIPDVRLVVTADSLYKRRSLKEVVKESSYHKYIKTLIEKYELRDNIEWAGYLTEEQMVEHYLSSNVYACASNIENSPNSMGEAMLLGVPVVVSDVGGVRSLLEDKKEGLLFDKSDVSGFANYVLDFLGNSEYAKQIGQSGRRRALKVYDRQHNLKKLCDVYFKIKNQEILSI